MKLLSGQRDVKGRFTKGGMRANLIWVINLLLAVILVLGAKRRRNKLCEAERRI